MSLKKVKKREIFFSTFSIIAQYGEQPAKVAFEKKVRFVVCCLASKIIILVKKG